MAQKHHHNDRSFQSSPLNLALTDLTTRPEVSPEQRSSSELVKRIRKLRWIGLEQEAERLQIGLYSAEKGDTVLGGPHETD